MTNLFVALTPLKNLDRKILEFKSQQKKFLIKGMNVNWSKDYQHHITLNYIGSIEPEQKKEMFEELDSCSFPYKELPIEITTFNYFPNENGQVLVANISLSTQLQSLYDRIEEIVTRIGFGMPLPSYRPHITLARFKDKDRPFSDIVEVEDPITSLVFSVDVYESEFKSGKTIHKLIKTKSFT